MNLSVAILFAVVTLFPTSASAVIGRRSFLKGLSLVTGGLVGPSAPAGPSAPLAIAPLKQASEVLIANRIERIAKIGSHNLLYAKQSYADFLRDPLPTGFREIVSAWRRQDPAGRAHVIDRMREIDELIARAEVDGRLFKGDSECAIEIDRRISSLKSEIQDWPYSEMDISLVFAEPIARAENAIAAELDVDIGLVHQLVDHIFSVNTDEAMGLFETLASKRGLVSVPIYSRRTIEVVERHFRRISDGLADAVHARNAAEGLNAWLIRRGLIASSGNFKLRESNRFRFQFDKHSAGFDRLPDPSRMVVLYQGAYAHLEKLRSGLTALEPSAVRDLALTELADLDRLLIAEVRDLPESIRAHNVAFNRRHQDEAESQSEEYAQPSPAEWAHALMTLSRAAPALAPLAGRVAAELTESGEPEGCAEHLLTSPAAQLAPPSLVEPTIDFDSPAAPRVPVPAEKSRQI